MKLDLIGLVVADISRSVSFYRLLGWNIPTLEPGEDHHEIGLENGIRIAWDAESMIREIEPDWKQPVGQRVSLAFLCDSPAAVDSTYQAIVQAGYKGHREPWDAFWGQRYAQVSDPDGNTLDLFAPQTAES